MVEIKYNLLDKVIVFNTATGRFDEEVVKDIRILPTAISKDENGEDVLDAYEVIYCMRSGLMANSQQVFDSAEQALEHYGSVLQQLGAAVKAAVPTEDGVSGRL